MEKTAAFKDLLGKTLFAIGRGTNRDGNEALIFLTIDDKMYEMAHSQDCCEHVYLEEIHGDLRDLIGVPLLHVEERTENGGDEYESSTWTFYELRTIKGSVTLRWLGTSNGYYSEGVDFVEVTHDRNDLRALVLFLNAPDTVKMEA